MRVSTTDLQNAFGKYLALTEKEEIVVTKNGRSVAKLVRHVEPDYVLVHEESMKYKAPRKISYEEYMDLVNSSDQRYELIDGEVYLLASPSFKHQMAVNEIAGRFYNFFNGKSCRSATSPLDIRLFGFATKFEEDPNVVQPDIVVVCDIDKINKDGKYEGVPTLVVEVLSPSTKGKDIATKLQLYMKSGVKEYWVVDIENRLIIQYTFTEKRDISSIRTIAEKETIRSDFFKGLQIMLQDIFQNT